MVYDIFNFLFEIGGEGEGGIFHVIQTRHELNYSIMFCVFFLLKIASKERKKFLYACVHNKNRVVVVTTVVVRRRSLFFLFSISKSRATLAAIVWVVRNSRRCPHACSDKEVWKGSFAYASVLSRVSFSE